MSFGSYKVSVDGRDIPVESFTDVQWAAFDARSECEVEVRTPESIGRPGNLRFISRYSLLPARRGLASTSSGNTVRFRLSGATSVVVTIDDMPKLFIFADPPDSSPPRMDDTRMVNVRDYVSDGAGRTCQTDNIQKAITFLRKNGILYFPPGIYMSGPLTLRSNSTIYLARGAVLKSTADRALYALDASAAQPWPAQCFIRADGLQDVTIAGPGVIDGSGSAIRNEQVAPHLLLVRNCKDVRVENIVLRDSAAWTAHTIQSSRVRFRNVKILNNMNVLNTDGFDVQSSTDVDVEDCFALCADDPAVVKSAGGVAASSITFRGCVLYTAKSALKVGTESDGDISRVVFKDNDVMECDRGMTLACEDGHVISDVQFVGNTFLACRPDARRRLIDFYTWDRKGCGRIENVLIKDCTASARWPRPSTFFPASGPIKGIRFDNFVIGDKVCRNTSDADLLMDVLPNCDMRKVNVQDISFVPGDPQGWNPALLNA